MMINKVEICGVNTAKLPVLKENEMRLFVNGKLADQMPLPVPLAQLPGTELLIGTDCDVPADKELTAKPFQGLVHSLKIYRGEKKEKDIAKLYKKAVD